MGVKYRCAEEKARMAGVGMYGATTPRAVATVPRHGDLAVAPSAHNGRKALECPLSSDAARAAAGLLAISKVHLWISHARRGIGGSWNPY